MKALVILTIGAFIAVIGFVYGLSLALRAMSFEGEECLNGKVRIFKVGLTKSDKIITSMITAFLFGMAIFGLIVLAAK